MGTPLHVLDLLEHVCLAVRQQPNLRPVSLPWGASVARPCHGPSTAEDKTAIEFSSTESSLLPPPKRWRTENADAHRANANANANVDHTPRPRLPVRVVLEAVVYSLESSPRAAKLRLAADDDTPSSALPLRENLMPFHPYHILRGVGKTLASSRDVIGTVVFPYSGMRTFEALRLVLAHLGPSSHTLTTVERPMLSSIMIEPELEPGMNSCESSSFSSPVDEGMHTLPYGDHTSPTSPTVIPRPVTTPHFPRRYSRLSLVAWMATPSSNTLPLPSPQILSPPPSPRLRPVATPPHPSPLTLPPTAGSTLHSPAPNFPRGRSFPSLPFWSSLLSRLPAPTSIPAPVGMTSLPEEAILRILVTESRGSPDRMVTLGHVCRRWHRLARHPSLWRRIDNARAVRFALRLDVAQHVEEILLCEWISPECLMELFAAARYALVRCEISGAAASAMTNESLITLARAQPPFLRCVLLRGCVSLTESAIQQFLEACPSIHMFEATPMPYDRGEHGRGENGREET